MAIVKFIQRIEHEIEVDTDKFTPAERIAFIKQHVTPGQLARVCASCDLFKLEKLMALAIEQSQLDPLAF